MRNRLLFFIGFVAVLFLVPALAAHAETPRLAGTIEARLDGRTIRLPSLKTDVHADIAGDLATVSVVQTFANPGEVPLDATYLFPLNHDAAVYEMSMEVGAERIRAQIQETQQAEQTFARAKSEGRAAALLKQQRPNMFTQQVANLMPGLPITVTLRYVQTVPKVDGDYQLVIPLVVGPRFQPPDVGVLPAVEAVPEPVPAAASAGHWTLDALPAYPPVFGLELPPTIDAGRVALSITLDGGLPVRALRSDTHAIDARAESALRWQIGLEAGRVVDNRDFVLRYSLAGSGTAAGLLTHYDARGGFFSLLIEPPAAPDDADITPREMVFLLDCSGSMHGLPMSASKAFMRAALSKLRPTDHFRIIRFSDSATEFSREPLPATPDNIRRGIDYTDRLQGMGGTMMSSGIRQALEVPPPPGTQRIVTFLTDGYIGNEYEILRMVYALLGDARLYAFGVGSGVNRFLLDEIGRAGRGFTRYMDPTEDVESVAAELTERLQSPLLTDIEIDWNGLPVAQLAPAAIPDLFAGQSIRIQWRYDKAARGTIRIHGRAGGRARGRVATQLV
ncbi:MAG: VIT domain-containing protein, partial [Pseudomonadota bacterium]